MKIKVVDIEAVEQPVAEIQLQATRKEARLLRSLFGGITSAEAMKYVRGSHDPCRDCEDQDMYRISKAMIDALDKFKAVRQK
jgi:hypothetical protein